MEKIKRFIESGKGKDILTIAIVILVGLGSFELGRLSKAGDSSGIKVEYASQNPIQQGQTEKAISSENSSKTASVKNAPIIIFFASNRGSKYYPVGCSAGKTIKQENRIYFATEEEAEKAGYTLSSSCH